MSAPTAHAVPVPAEIRSTLLLVDYYRQWHRHRRLFFGGLLVIAIAAVILVELKTPYYNATSTFFISDRVRPENLVSVKMLVDITANEQYRSAQNGVLADRILHSNDLLIEASERLAKGSDGEQPVKLDELLGIYETDPQLRQQALCYRLKREVLDYAPVQNSGTFEVSAELPDRYAAARFVNLCVELLKERFTKIYFESYDNALKVSREQFAREQKQRSERTGELSYGDTVDLRPAVAQKHILIEAYMKLQAERLATMADKIQGFEMITDERVKEVTQPVQVIERALPPLDASRPNKPITVVLICLVYTFVFMLGLMFKGYADAALRQIEVEDNAPRD